MDESVDYSIDDRLDEGGGAQSRMPYIPDLHLRSAILDHDKELFLGCLADPTGVCTPQIRRSATAFRSFISETTHILKDGERFYPYLMTDLGVTQEMVQDSLPVKGYRRSINIANMITEGNISLLFKDVKDQEDLSYLTRLTHSFNTTPELDKALYLRVLWGVLRDSMKITQEAEDYTFKPLLTKADWQGWYNGHFVVMKHGEDHYVYNYSQVMLLSDTVTSRFIAILVATIYEHLRSDLFPSPQQIQKIYSWGDKIISRSGNEGYKSIKALEAICTGVHLSKNDPLRISKDFLSNLIKSAPTEEIRQDWQGLVHILNKIAEKPNHLFEIFGLFRHFGHPTVDETASCIALKNISRLDIPVDPEVVQLVMGAYKKRFILEMIAIQHRWPNCSCTPEMPEDSPIRKLVETKPTNIRDYGHSDVLRHWFWIKFEKEFEFNDHADFTDLISDTSVSPPKEHYFSVYNKELIDPPHSEPSDHDRRLLLEILKAHDFSLKAIRERIQRGDIPESWKVIGLHPKERENKSVARLFAMMVAEMRMYFSATESNVAEQIFKYLPCQTMTWSEAELTQHLLRLTNPSASDRYVTVVTSIDLEKFNQRWRKESTIDLYEMYDQLFGTKGLYTYSHEFFMECFYYLSSHLNPPEELLAQVVAGRRTQKEYDTMYPDGKLCWQGQLGGCEGLRQKPWTAIMIAALLANEELTGVKTEIIGQGDNQVMVSQFPIRVDQVSGTDYVTQYGDMLEADILSYLNSLTKICDGLGMKLKLEESWSSTTLMNYGKDILFNGSFTTQLVKKICRMFPDNSDAYASIGSRIGSIYTAAHSSTSKSMDAIYPYHIATMETAFLIRNEAVFGPMVGAKLKHRLKSEKIKIDDSLVLFFLLFSKDFGGYPVMPFLEFLYRGHPDPVTSYLVWLKHLSLTIPMARRIMAWVTSRVGVKPLSDDNSSKDYKLLIQDPLALNYIRHFDMTRGNKQMFQDALISFTENAGIHKMVETYDEESFTELIDYLMTIQPCFPRVLNEILRLSPEGAKAAFIDVFTDMRTMRSLLGPSQAHHLLRTLVADDIEWYVFVAKAYHNIYWGKYLTELKRMAINPTALVDADWNCTYTLAKNLRIDSWGRELTGSTTPHPKEQFRTWICKGENCPGCGISVEKTIFIYSPQNAVHDRMKGCLHLTRGTLEPYAGSRTREKRGEGTVKAPRSDKSIVAAQKLFRLHNWICESGSTVDEFVMALIRTRSDISVNMLEMLVGANYGGSAVHRFSDVITKSVSRPNIRQNFFTRLFISSDEMGRFSKGYENYTLHFQGVFLSGLTMISTLALFFPDLFGSYQKGFHSHVSCEECCDLIQEEKLSSEETPPTIPTARGCPFIFSSFQDIAKTVSWEAFQNSTLIHPSEDQESNNICGTYAMAYILLSISTPGATPLISTAATNYYHSQSNSALSLGSLCKMDLEEMFEYLSRLWLCDNLDAVLEEAVHSTMDLELVTSMYLSRYPSGSFAVLQELLCFPELREKLTSCYAFTPISSEAYYSKNSLDLHIHQIIQQHVATLISDGDFLIQFFCTCPGLSLNRVVKMWIHSLVLTSDWETTAELQARIRDIGVIFRECVAEGQVNMSLLVQQYLAIRDLNPSYPDPKLECPFQLSAIGAEPWVSRVDHTEITEQESHQAEPRKPGANFKSAMLFRNADLVSNIPFFAMKESTIEANLALLETHQQTCDRIHHRDDHRYRLTGIHSTAHNKYMEIFEKNGCLETEGSVHLAEGSGGVARLAHEVLGSEILIYNSLYSVDNVTPHRAVGFIPAALQGLPSFTKLLGVQASIVTGGDLLNPEVVETYSDLVQSHRDKISLLTCDAETSGDFETTIALSLVRGVVCIASNLKLRSLVVIKAYISNCYLTYMCVNELLRICPQVNVQVPHFSSHEAHEVFIVGRVGDVKPLKLPDMTITRILDDAYSFSSLQALQSGRIHSAPFASSLSPGDLEQIYLFNISHNIRDNYSHSVRLFCNNFINPEVQFDTTLRLVCDLEERMYHGIVKRLLLLNRSQLGKTLKLANRVLLLRYRADSHEIHLFAETMYNCKMLIQLWHGCPTEEILGQEDMIICYKGVPLYTHRFFYQNWISKFGRSWHKIAGHLSVAWSIPVPVSP